MTFNWTPDELDAKRQEWAMYHDKKTAGIMGFQPHVKSRQDSSQVHFSLWE